MAFFGWRMLFPGENPPLASGPVEATITSDGGEWRISEAVRIEFPAGAFLADTVVRAVPVADPPPIDPVEPAAHPLVGQVYDITMGQPLQQTVTIVVSYRSPRAPAGSMSADYRLLEYHEGDWYALPTAVYPDTEELRAETDRFSLLGWGLVGGLLVAGTAAVAYGLAVQAASEDPTYLEPDKVHPEDGFRIDTTSLTPSVKIGRDARLWDRSWKIPFTRSEVPLFPTYASEMEKDPNGMCMDFAPYLASLFISQGYRTRVVLGDAKQPRIVDGQTVEKWTGHTWVEVLIGDTVYYVNTAPTQDEVRPQSDPTWHDGEPFQLIPAGVGFELIPLDQVTAHGTVLNPRRMLWKDLKDDWTGYETHSARSYEAEWWKKYLSGSDNPSVGPTPSVSTQDQASAVTTMDIYLPQTPQGWRAFDPAQIHTERNDGQIPETTAQLIGTGEPVVSSGALTIAAGINDDPRFKPIPSYTPTPDSDYHRYEGGHIAIGALEGAYVIDRTKYDSPRPREQYNAGYDAWLTGHDGAWIHIQGTAVTDGPNSDASARQEEIIADFKEIVRKLDIKFH